jgi:ABC-type transporter MlaC component
MNLKSIATILVLAAASVCAQAQQSTPAKPTKEDTQKVFKVISSDKAKLQTFCDIAKLGDEMEKANEKRDSKKFEELSLKEDELVKKLGAEYATLIDGIQNVDPQTEDGQEISSTIQALDKLCPQ